MVVNSYRTLTETKFIPSYETVKNNQTGYQ